MTNGDFGGSDSPEVSYASQTHLNLLLSMYELFFYCELDHFMSTGLRIYA